MSLLFRPIEAGELQLSHRIVLAPLTRFRADDQHIPLPLATEYYAQRASTPGTLLITEGTFISSRAGGNHNVPGIWNQKQIDAWKNVTDAVHSKGSFIFCQLWALGRAANPEVLKEDGHKLMGPSAIAMKEGATVPIPVTEEDIQGFIQDYANAARNAIEAGFDGVEIHGANGYLADQFLQDVSNNREDEWGGSVEKRARFGLAVAKAVADAVGAEKVGYRISPWSPFQGMKMQDPVPQFSYLVKGLEKLNLLYLHIVEARISGSETIEASLEHADFMLDIWTRTVILAGGFTFESATEALDKYKKHDVLIAFGRHFLANPDLPFRLKEGIELNKYYRPTFYTPKDPHGYIDYPFSGQYQALQSQTA